MDCYITSDNVCNPTLIEVTHQQKISDLLSLLQRQNLFHMIASKFHFFGGKIDEIFNYVPIFLVRK